jgi:hypothetical protein
MSVVLLIEESKSPTATAVVASNMATLLRMLE